MPSAYHKICIVIPAFNEEMIIGQVVKQVTKLGYQVIVVDDGSRDNTFLKAKENGALSLRHRLNRGKGAALKTGIEAAKLIGANLVVTMDGDGQHDPQDISKLIKAITHQGYAVALGTRHLKLTHIPWQKVVHNFVANTVTLFFAGTWTNDSQSGFRAFGPQALALINTRADTYEYESEVIREIKTHSLPFIEVPINTIYTQYSMNKTHKQSIRNGFLTLYKMLWRGIS